LCGIERDSNFRGDAAFASPEMYEFLEAQGIGYPIRLPADDHLSIVDGRTSGPGLVVRGV
jgi:hypothetical protein